jgi:ABC-2 type transport system ATP-binding protein
MQETQLVETTELSKVYGDNIAVDKLNLKIKEGEIFGFLGPNGAGKTTTILMLLGLTEPTSGTANVCGFNSTREPLKVKRQVGYVPERVGFYEDLTARQNLKYMAMLNDLSESDIDKRIVDALAYVGLSKVTNNKVQTFSRGMKQRLAIADVLVKLPRVAILDEPTSCIGPEGVRELLSMISRIAKDRNMTIIMSSHQLHLVQQICSRVGIMMKGKMVAEGPIQQLGRQTLGGGKFQIEVKVQEVTAGLIDNIKAVSGVLGITQKENELLVSCEKDLGPQVAKAIVDSGALLLQLKVQSYSLEDIYSKYFAEG